MSYLLQWGEAPQYQYEEDYDSLESALDWINNAFGGLEWNINHGGHWFKLYKAVELERVQVFKGK